MTLGQGSMEPDLRRYSVLYIWTKILVFVEVKLRRGTGFGFPLEAVTPHKQSTLRSVAEHYLYTRRPPFHTLRFDVIGILADRPDVRLDHIEDAFWGWMRILVGT
jgi:Holliday junction resolvase-like predicted endonuclease